MKVLLATDIEELNTAVANEKNIEVVHQPVQYREAVLQVAQKTVPDVVVLTAWLDGTVDIIDIAYELRSLDIRIVFLAGTLEQADPVVQGVARLSVYDILFGEITVGQVINKINNPTPASQGIPLLDGRGNTPKEDNETKTRGKIKLEQEKEKDENSKTPKESPFQKFLKTKEKFKIGFSIPKLSKGKNKADQAVLYIPHHIISVWSPVGGMLKSLTAFNLAVTAAEKGFDTALINYDLTCPVLDKWFKIPNTSLNESHDARGAGVMTFGADLKPEIATKMLMDYGWGVNYLPAGNKLGNLGTPDIPMEVLEKVIQLIYRRHVNGKPAVTIIDTSSVFEMPVTFAALKSSSRLIVPTHGGKQEGELINDHLTELERLDLKLQTHIVNWNESDFGSQFTIPYIHEKLITSSNQRKPYCLLLEENPFETILDDILN